MPPLVLSRAIVSTEDHHGAYMTKVTEVYLQLSNADVAEAHREFSPVANLGKKKRRS